MKDVIPDYLKSIVRACYNQSSLFVCIFYFIMGDSYSLCIQIKIHIHSSSKLFDYDNASGMQRVYLYKTITQNTTLCYVNKKSHIIIRMK